MQDNIYTQEDSREVDYGQTIQVDTFKRVGGHTGKQGRAGRKGQCIAVNEFSVLTPQDIALRDAQLGIVGSVASETAHLGGTFEERFNAGFIGLTRGFELLRIKQNATNVYLASIGQKELPITLDKASVKVLFSNVLGSIQYQQHPARQTQAHRAIREAQVMSGNLNAIHNGHVAPNQDMEALTESIALPVVELDASRSMGEEDSDATNGECVGDSNAVNPLQACISGESKEMVAIAIGKLDSEERRVLHKFFWKDETLEQREYAIKNRAVKRLQGLLKQGLTLASH